MNKRIFASCIVLSLCLAPAYAGREGTTAFNFLKIGVGAKAIGTGGAFSAVADDASAAYWNPAGLAQLRYRQLSGMHLSWLENVNYQYLSYVQPTERAGTLGVSACYLATGDIPAYSGSGARLDAPVTASDLALAFSYARTFGRTDAGVTAKLIRETLAGDAAQSYALDAGLLYRLGTGRPPADWIGQELRLAFSVQNMGPGVRFIRESDPLPLNYRLGIAQDFFAGSLTVSADFNAPGDADSYAAAGADYRLTDWIALRAGYRLPSRRPAYDMQPGLMGGFGIGNEYVRLDYAFVPYSDLGSTHRVSLSCRFGRAYDRRLFETKIQERLAAGRSFYRKKDLVNAYRAFDQVLAVDPVNEEAKEYAGLIRKRIDEVKLDSYLALAKKYWVQDRLVEAKDVLENVALLFPGDAGVKDFLARIRDALQELQALRTETLFSQGMEFFRQKRYADAVSLWEKVLLIAPQHAGAAQQIALAREELARLAELKRQEEREALRKKADDRFRQGVAFYKSRQWEKARQSFIEADRLFPGRKETQDYIAECRAQIADEQYRKGMKCYDDGNLPGAVRLWEEAAALATGNAELSDRLAKARAELREINRAKAEEYNRQGLKEYGIGNLPAAIELWEKALALEPDNARIRNSVNRAKEELGKRK